MLPHKADTQNPPAQLEAAADASIPPVISLTEQIVLAEVDKLLASPTCPQDTLLDLRQWLVHYAMQHLNAVYVINRSGEATATEELQAVAPIQTPQVQQVLQQGLEIISRNFNVQKRRQPPQDLPPERTADHR